MKMNSHMIIGSIFVGGGAALWCFGFWVRGPGISSVILSRTELINLLLGAGGAALILSFVLYVTKP